MNNVLQEVREWMLDARDEDNRRYFFPVHDLHKVEMGARPYVIGRKGSGKTAVAEHIKGLKSPRRFVKSLSFKNFPFNELYSLADKGFTRPSQFTTIWKYIIYSAICSMMAENRAIDEIVARELRKHFNVDVEHALARSISKLTDKAAGFTIMGSGANAALKTISVPNETPWPERVQALEDVIRQNIDNSDYYIVFDELDEDYKDVLDVDQSSQYFDLLIGLFKAVHDIKRRLSTRARIAPIIFLRDDIFSLMRDNDKNKWSDSALTLTWSEGALQQLFAFRVSRAINASGTILSFKDAVLAMFFTETKRVNSARSGRRHIFNHIAARTMMRPRDIISWTREAAKVADDQGVPKIRTEMFVATDRAYSLRFRAEFIDEIQAAVPYINDVFDILSQQRKAVFTFREFGELYSRFSEERPEIKPLRFEDLCRVLFHFSVIGTQPSQRTAKIFSYESPGARINFSENVMLHPGLLKALQIT